MLSDHFLQIRYKLLDWSRSRKREREWDVGWGDKERWGEREDREGEREKEHTLEHVWKQFKIKTDNRLYTSLKWQRLYL